MLNKLVNEFNKGYKGITYPVHKFVFDYGRCFNMLDRDDKIEFLKRVGHNDKYETEVRKALAIYNHVNK